MHDLNKKPDEMEIEPLKIDTTVLPIPQNKTFYGKIVCIKQELTVEPIMAIFMMSTYISKTAVQNLNLEKVCRVAKNYGDEICGPLLERSKNTTMYEVEIQQIISEIEAWRTIISTVLPLIILIYMGAWSDRTGNRMVSILLPIVGEFSVNISNLLSTFFFDSVSAEVTMFLEAFFPAITGNYWLMSLGIHCYVIDITEIKERTFRLGLVLTTIIVGIPVGMAISGVLLKATGYYGVFFITACLNATIFLYGYIILKPRTTATGQKSIKISDVITLQKETALIVFKRRTGKTRVKIIFTLLIISIVYGQDTGEHVVLYLYTRYRLNWDVYTYSFFTAFGSVLNTFGCIFSLFVFSKKLGWDDSSVGIIAVASKAVSSIYTSFATTDFLMYMSPVVAVLSTTKYAVARSMGSKLVPTRDAGKINSLISLMETLGGLVFNPAYSLLYAATLEYFTGAVFIFTALTSIPVIGMLLWLFKEQRRELKINRTEEFQNTSN